MQHSLIDPAPPPRRPATRLSVRPARPSRPTTRTGQRRRASAYDWREQRVAASMPGYGAVHTIHDGEGRLLAEHDGTSGAVLREYVWLDSTLIAAATGPAASPAWSFVTTGHLDEPLLLTDASGAVTSSLTRDPWGNPVLLAGGAPLALGYPGQWKDPATGLFQNWHRDYDPTLGRYVEADPIGLEGGSNLYGYVGGNPVNLVDPSGLWCETVRVGARSFVNVCRGSGDRTPILPARMPPRPPSYDPDCPEGVPPRRSPPDNWQPDLTPYTYPGYEGPVYSPPRSPRPRKSVPVAEPKAAPKDWCGSGWSSSLVPEAPGGYNVAQACKKHDGCYGPQSGISRLTCDRQFRRDILAECTASGGSPLTCSDISNTYYLGVRIGGCKSYEGNGGLR